MRKRDKRQKKRVGYESHSAPSSFPSLPFSESVSGVSFRSPFPEFLMNQCLQTVLLHPGKDSLLA